MKKHYYPKIKGIFIDITKLKKNIFPVIVTITAFVFMLISILALLGVHDDTIAERIYPIIIKHESKR